ncbi:DUF4998 domain-containing protein [Mucilaginibacter celer]|uniref:DUF4959 domain-containing protein n=1 Tax=Mucilaginibacter celer TaxID=2305508 RepID=A0A494W4U6_9SPHI|nr:DUF4998 domain-containing protein [Mucilaginibacter celer]AYL98515.1 hypothetical protein HYN43_025970 [Mucilaginibacter celer]
MKKLIYILCCCFMLIAVYSCKKNHQTDFRNFLGDHEVVYTGSVGKVTIQPGNLEIGLKWAASSDPSITKYVIYYNNKADSSVVNISGKTDTIRAVIKNLAEYTYSFTIYSYDAKGNRSIPTEINNAKVYGPLYIGTLQNRSYNATRRKSFARELETLIGEGYLLSLSEQDMEPVLGALSATGRLWISEATIDGLIDQEEKAVFTYLRRMAGLLQLIATEQGKKDLQKFMKTLK